MMLQMKKEDSTQGSSLDRHIRSRNVHGIGTRTSFQVRGNQFLNRRQRIFGATVAPIHLRSINKTSTTCTGPIKLVLTLIGWTKTSIKLLSDLILQISQSNRQLLGHIISEGGWEATNEHQLIRRINAKLSEIDLKTVENLMKGRSFFMKKNIYFV